MAVIGKHMILEFIKAMIDNDDVAAFRLCPRPNNFAGRCCDYRVTDIAANINPRVCRGAPQ